MRSALTAAAALALVPLTMAWNVELPPCLEQFKPFVSSGCFQDGNPPALVYRSSQDQTNMTVEKCVAECKGMSCLCLFGNYNSTTQPGTSHIN